MLDLTMVLLFLLGGVVINDSLAVHDESVEDEVNALVTRWQGMSESVVSAQIEGRHFLIHCDLDGLMASSTPSELDQLFGEQLVPCLGKSDEAERIKAITASLLSKPGMTGGWSTFSIVSGADQLRNDEKYETGAIRARVRGPGREVYHSSDINQAGVSAKSSSLRMVTLQDIWYVPRKEMFDPGGGAQLGVSGGSTGRLMQDGIEVLFDDQTLFVSRVSWKKADGRLIREVLQVLPQTFDGYVLPYLSATCHYKNRGGQARLQHADFFLIDSASINIEVSEEAYHVSVPSGTVVVNDTLKEPAPKVFETELSVENVADAVPPIAVSSGNPERDVTVMHIMIFNLLLVVPVVVIMILRQLRRKDRV